MGIGPPPALPTSIAGVASRFELRWRDGWQRGTAFLDYIIDGGSLWSDYGVGPEFGETPPLGWLPAAADHEAAARLVLEAPPDLGERTSIFVCAFCGDLDCGSTSVVIERDGDDIVWRDPASTTPDYRGDEVYAVRWTRSGWVRKDGLPLPDVPDTIVGAYTFREGFEAWPSELRFDYDEYREAILNRPPSVHTPTPSPTRRRRRAACSAGGDGLRWTRDRTAPTTGAGIARSPVDRAVEGSPAAARERRGAGIRVARYRGRARRRRAARARLDRSVGPIGRAAGARRTASV